ncbi:hypothetical protein M885DRAFT_511208 [Pelagophyceae sp. CCMP2097]|nr:hypothetical protein M885DRAFT_511208 [Pelagophyceae sp. CCMP2097]
MRTPFEFFPNMYMALINIRWLGHKTRPVQAVFRIPPKMGKFEVREYLTQIYKLPVKKVMTENIDGKKKRIHGRSRLIAYKRADYKRAIVTFEKDAIVYTPVEMKEKDE